MDPLTPLASCNEEEVCTPLEEVPTGYQLAVSDQITNCIKRLLVTGNTVIISDGEHVKGATGASGGNNEIILDELQDLGEGLPTLVGQNGGGELGQLNAPAGDTVQFVSAHNGGFFLEDFLPPACFEEDQVCECSPDWLAGFARTLQPDGSYKWCLVRFPEADLPVPDPVYMASTSTVQITGTGTAGNPFKATVKIASASGNIIEAQSDGVFAACCDAYGDPLSGL